MKYFSLILMFFILINIHAQSSSKFKDDALQFSLEVVKTFFQKDNNMYLDKISDSIFSLTGKGIYLKKKINYRLTESFKEAVKDKSKTFQDYQAFYKYEVLTIEDLVKTYNIRLPNYYKPKESDFFFIGGYKKNSKKDLPGFIWDDLYSFMVRKEGGKWIVKGFGE